MPTDLKIIRIANTGFLSKDNTFYTIDWAAWPASYFIRMPKVTDVGTPGHGFDFATDAIEVLKRNDGTASYYGEVTTDNAEVSPISATLELVHFSQTGHIGWRFTWACQLLDHFYCTRAISLTGSTGISPVGKYHAVAVEAGSLVLMPPYEVTAS